MYLHIDPHGGIPLGVQIAQGLRLAIATRRLEDGEQLPSARDLARDLRVNFHTVRKAYGELEAEGLLEVRRGLGTFVCAPRRKRTAELTRLVRQRLTSLLEEAARHDVEPEDIAGLVRRELARLVPGRQRRVRS